MGPSVTMISAGFVLTKMVGTWFGCGTAALGGMALRTSAKLASFGRRPKAGGSFVTGLNGPAAAGAASQRPLFSRNHVPAPSGSKKTFQFVLTAYFSPLSP